jgi:hypothetical protein
MTREICHRIRLTVLATTVIAGFAGTAMAVDPGVNQPGVAGNTGVGAPGPGTRDPGINQPGAAGNKGVGAPGVGAVDPGLNQPGVAGNVGGVARRSVRR